MFTLSGACAPQHQASMLAAASLLLATKPMYEVAVMLMDACVGDSRLQERASSLGALPIVLPGQLNATCHGDAYQPGTATARVASASSSTGYYHATYAKLQAWDLVQYSALLSLDNDVAVLTNLDGILDAMLRRHSEIREVRTPQGCMTQKMRRTSSTRASGVYGRTDASGTACVRSCVPGASSAMWAIRR